MGVMLFASNATASTGWRDNGSAGRAWIQAACPMPSAPLAVFPWDELRAALPRLTGGPRGNT
jgi:hypothetical protein